jgi:hypothetical protein
MVLALLVLLEGGDNLDKWTKVLAILQLVDEFIVPLVERIKKIFGK